MILRNTTIVIVEKQKNGMMKIMHTLHDPQVPSKDGQPVFGPHMRRLQSVKEIAAARKISIQAARKLRKDMPWACLVNP